MEIFKANKQWANRPKDERFSSLYDLYTQTKAYFESANERVTNYVDLKAVESQGDVQIVGRAGMPARLTNWAFGQLAVRVGAPANYLRDLPAELAVQNLNHGLSQLVNEKVAKILFHQNGDLLARAITSEEYARIWNYEVAERLLSLNGWEPAVPDIRTSEDDFPALYASDHDMFAFLRAPNRTVEEGNGHPIWRGVIVENSEVGASKLKFTKFLYRAMCGNHIIWGASKVMEIGIVHIGSARDKWGIYAAQVQKWADESVSDDERIIEKAKHTLIAATKDEVLDAVFGKRQVGLSRKAIAGGYDAVVPDEDGDPNTVWGLVQGITRYSQTVPFADKRTEIDRAAGKLMEIEF